MPRSHTQVSTVCHRAVIAAIFCPRHSHSLLCAFLSLFLLPLSNAFDSWFIHPPSHAACICHSAALHRAFHSFGHLDNIIYNKIFMLGQPHAQKMLVPQLHWTVEAVAKMTATTAAAATSTINEALRLTLLLPLSFCCYYSYCICSAVLVVIVGIAIKYILCWKVFLNFAFAPSVFAKLYKHTHVYTRTQD